MDRPGPAPNSFSPRYLFSRSREWSYTVIEAVIDKATLYLDEIEHFMTQESDTPKSSGKPSSNAPDSAKSSQSRSTEDPGRKSDAKRTSDQESKTPNGNRSVNASEKSTPPEDNGSLIDRLSGLTNSAYRLARRTTGTSLKVGKAIIKSQDQLKVMLAAGQSLRDLREVAGLTVSDMADALNLKDKTLLEAVENGTATLSFELILRLAALLARNDPIPFILRYTRTYSPETWRILHDWGIGRIPLHFERERNFINIYRSHDAARKLSDEGFEKVLEFTRKAFELSLHFIAEQEHIDRLDSEEEMDEAQRLAEELKQRHEKDMKGS